MNIQEIVDFVREQYKTTDNIPLHAPSFGELELKYVSDTIKSSFVSSVGQFVNKFEDDFSLFTSSANSIATVNGTAALHAGLVSLGITRNDFVITQALTFVATCNAIRQAGADPIFCDVSRVSLGLCPVATENFLKNSAEIRDGKCIHIETKRQIKAILVMHTFGHPVQLFEFQQLCDEWKLLLIEDCAESLGSYYERKHTGNFGTFGTFSFNGNKIITTGGGGMITTNSEVLAKKIKHITTTAKVPHLYEFIHDEPGFNYRLPNLNAALGCAQLQRLETFLKRKRMLASYYKDFFRDSNFKFLAEPTYAKSNYWLNAVECENLECRDWLLKESNRLGVMTRPIWKLMSDLEMFKSCISDDLEVSKAFADTVVNLPSSVIAKIN